MQQKPQQPLRQIQPQNKGFMPDNPDIRRFRDLAFMWQHLATDYEVNNPPQLADILQRDIDGP